MQIALFLLLFSSLFASIELPLKTMSFEERVYLKEFFRNSFLWDGLGHVLFYETKPACLLFISSSPHYEEHKLYKGWMTWKKYEHLFPHPNYLFIEEKLAEGHFQIFVINLTTLQHCLMTHEAYFKKILGETFTPHHFLHTLETTKELTPLLQHDQSLLGLLLGYGQESSLAFKEKCHTAHWTESYQGVSNQEPKGSLLSPIGFMGDPQSSEVKNLISTYEEEQKEIWKKYQQKGDTLRLVLERLTSNSHNP